jgi:hypothetical protein
MAYTNIDDPSAYFQVKLWTGNAGTNAITLDGNSDMQPDFMWHKEQYDTNGWHQFDSSRGAAKYLATQSTAAEGTYSGYLNSFDSNGFTAGPGDSSMNSSGTAQCSWMWHCNGGTTSSNTDGSITSTVQVNQDAGFSIVTWAGTASTATIGHGLGVAPKVVIIRARDKGVPTSWIVFHKDGSTSDDDYFILQGTFAKGTQAGLFNNQYPSSTVFGVANDFWVNSASTNYIAYCFAEKQGYSKFGKYVGNGSTNGPFVYTGFKPAFLMVKRVDSISSWQIKDSARNPNNLADKTVFANLGNAEYSTFYFYDLLSNGFKVRGTDAELNDSGGTYIYMAFAENPFVTSTGVPTTAR